MATRHVMRTARENVTTRPSNKVVKRKLEAAQTLGDFEMKPGYLYTVVRAISARVNQNYDGWPSDELKKAAHTFIGKPVFVNHENYDPTKARGVIVASRYIENGADKYIEVIQEVDAQRFPKLAHEIRTGGLDSVSMGAEAGFTICSYCGNKAQDVPDMCDHVLFHKGEKLSRRNKKTGKREEVLVYESCHKLSFFELSYVFEPADETAVASKVLVASRHVHSAECSPSDPNCGGNVQDDSAPLSGMAGFGNPKSTAESSGGAASGGGVGQAVGGGDLGDPAAAASSGGSGGTPQAGDAKYMPSTKGLYDDLSKSLPGVEIGTYRVDDYHEHDHGAMDVMTSDPEQAAMVRQKAFDAGSPYVLWQQKQWNADGTSSGMEDRGSPTQNHMDHVHTAPIGTKKSSFEERVLRTAGFKVAGKCDYCAGDAEEGRKSCSTHSKMEDAKFKAAVLHAAGWGKKPVEKPTVGQALSERFNFEPHPSGSGYQVIVNPEKNSESARRGFPGKPIREDSATAWHPTGPVKHFPTLDHAVDHAMGTGHMRDYRDNTPPIPSVPGADPHHADWRETFDSRGEFLPGKGPQSVMAMRRHAGPPPPPTNHTGIQSQPGMGPEDYVKPFQGRGYTPGTPVDVYRNLHADRRKQGMWSVKDSKSNLVLGHSDFAHMPGGKFFVGEGGNAKVQETGQKNVHAGVRGVLGEVPPDDHGPYTGITYNPKAGDTSFIQRESREPVHSADHVHLGPDGKAYTVNPRSNTQSFEARVLQAAGMHRMPPSPGKHAPGPNHDPRVPPGGFQVQDAKTFLSQPPLENESDEEVPAGPRHRASFEARVLRAFGETEAPASVDTLREEGSAPEDDNNDFYRYVEPPKDLQTPDLSQAAQIDREQDQNGQAGMDGAPGEFSPESEMGGGGPVPGAPAGPQQQFMELKIPIPAPGQAGASGAPSIPMQAGPPPPAPAPPAPAGPPAPPGPPGPPQQVAASTMSYMDRYFGRKVSREAMNLSNLSNAGADSTTSRNPRKGTANMARNTLASRGKVVTAGRRQHFAEGPLVDSGDQSRNDQGEQEEIFLSQTPPAEAVVTPKDGEEISNTENNLVARVQKGRAQLLRDAQALASYRKQSVEQAGGPTPTKVDPTVNTGPGGRELADEADTISADPNENVTETQPKDASLHAFKSFDRWLASKTGKPSRQHTSATIRRAADDYSRSAGISVQAMFPALGIVLREARRNEKVAQSKGANMRKRADEKLEVAAPDDRINVEAPTEGTTDADAQASQFDLHDFGNNAGDNLADPDLSTDQNWAPGEAKQSSRMKTAGGILAFRLAEAMIAAGIEANTAERKYQLAGHFENQNRAMVQSHIALCEKFAAVLQNVSRRQVASGSTRGAALKAPIPANLGAQRTAGRQIVANDPKNDSTLFV